MSEHWTPPAPGKTNIVTSLSTGEFPTMGSELHHVTWARPTNGSSRPRTGLSKGTDPTVANKRNRSNRSASTSETYGPTGVVTVARSYHGPGCPCCATTSSRRIPSAFGEQDNFRSGHTGSKAG